MIGNDIVDRARAKQDSNWQRKGFLDKLFSTPEQRLIQTANDPECMVWLLWSMKESAYKATTRQTGKRLFNPKKIRCTLESWSGEATEGQVFYEQEYRTKSVITSGYIASVAFSVHDLSPPEQTIISLDRADYQSQSTQLRTIILQRCTMGFGIPARSVQVSNDHHGGPVLVIQNSSRGTVNLPISISHHGHYGAYSLSPAIGRLMVDLRKGN